MLVEESQIISMAINTMARRQRGRISFTYVISAQMNNEQAKSIAVSHRTNSVYGS